MLVEDVVGRFSARGGRGAPLTNWVSAHPATWGLISGMLAFSLVLAVTVHVAAAGAAGTVFGLFNWYIWRPNGPAHGWKKRMDSRKR